MSRRTLAPVFATQPDAIAFRLIPKIQPGRGTRRYCHTDSQDTVMFVLDLLARWAHVGAAIVLMGGAIFTRFVLLPAAAELPDDQHQALKERLRVRWSKIVAGGILLLMLSGFYNFAMGIPTHKGQPLYHALVGTKMLLAFAAFFLASVLSGRSAKFAPLRANAAKWLGILIVILTLISGIGGFLKVGVTPTPAAKATTN